MSRHPTRLGLAAALALLGAACDGPLPAEPAPEPPQPAVAAMAEAAAAGNELSPALCDPSRGGFVPHSTNPYFPLRAGSRWWYEGEEEGVELELRITVLHRTEVVAGVLTRVVEEREWQDEALVEVSRNYFAQARDGTVCYFGEAVDIYEDGRIVSHEGAWRADEPGHRPGIMMPARPRPGLSYQMEGAPGIAEDRARVVGRGRVWVEAGRFRDAIRVRERNPLDGDVGLKVYAPGVGLVRDGPVELERYRL